MPMHFPCSCMFQCARLVREHAYLLLYYCCCFCCCCCCCYYMSTKHIHTGPSPLDEFRHCPPSLMFFNWEWRVSSTLRVPCEYPPHASRLLGHGHQCVPNGCSPRPSSNRFRRFRCPGPAKCSIFTETWWPENKMFQRETGQWLRTARRSSRGMLFGWSLVVF